MIGISLALLTVVGVFGLVTVAFQNLLAQRVRVRVAAAAAR